MCVKYKYINLVELGEESGLVGLLFLTGAWFNLCAIVLQSSNSFSPKDSCGGGQFAVGKGGMLDLDPLMPSACFALGWGIQVLDWHPI